MKLLIRQRVFSWTDSYDVYDENGNAKYFVKAEFLSLGHRLTDGVTGEQFTQNAKVFCKTMEEAGCDAMIYSNMLWEAYELDLEKLSDYPVWYADYEELPQTPYRFSMWQYSSTGSVTGIGGNVDLDIQFVKR